jgi:hypothetical protein
VWKRGAIAPLTLALVPLGGQDELIKRLAWLCPFAGTPERAEMIERARQASIRSMLRAQWGETRLEEGVVFYSRVRARDTWRRKDGNDARPGYRTREPWGLNRNLDGTDALTWTLPTG